MQAKQVGVHLVKKDGKIIAMFLRDEESNENVIYTLEKASLNEIESLFNRAESKI